MFGSANLFPIFRKYENNRSIFKIISPTQFIEIQVMGNKYFKHELNAKILPDFQLITDMINLHNGHWLEASSDEFESVYRHYQDQSATS